MHRTRLIQTLSSSALMSAALWLSGCDEKPKPDTAKPEVATQQPIAILSTDAQVMAGKTIHDANCISCHDSAVYSRNERLVNDFPALVAQVRRCDANLSTRLFDDEIQQVVAYLNQTYYHFKP